MDALRQRGHDCIETGWDYDRILLGNFDLCHIFHTNFSWSWGNFQAVMRAGKPFVLTPIYYPDLLAGITRSQLTELLSQAAYILPFSRREMDEIKTDWPVTGISRFEVIPNGTDSSFHADQFSNSENRHGVLCVAARMGDKNMSIVAGICDELGIACTLITGVAHKELPPIYARHKVFVNASGSERMSLTIGEALCAGCRVLATTENRGNEHYPGLVKFSPVGDLSRAALKGLIRGAALMPGDDWDWRPNEAARRLTWDQVAKDLDSVYRSVIK
jgi:glycosyltransferase involved in cell wall biosynthesis